MFETEREDSFPLMYPTRKKHIVIRVDSLMLLIIRNLPVHDPYPLTLPLIAMAAGEKIEVPCI